MEMVCDKRRNKQFNATELQNDDIFIVEADRGNVLWKFSVRKVKCFQL